MAKQGTRIGRLNARALFGMQAMRGWDQIDGVPPLHGSASSGLDLSG